MAGIRRARKVRPPHRPLTIDSRRIVHDLFSVRNMFSLGLRDNSGEFSMTAVLTCVTNFPNSLPDSVRYSTQQIWPERYWPRNGTDRHRYRSVGDVNSGKV